MHGPSGEFFCRWPPSSAEDITQVSAACRNPVHFADTTIPFLDRNPISLSHHSRYGLP